MEKIHEIKTENGLNHDRRKSEWFSVYWYSIKASGDARVPVPGGAPVAADVMNPASMPAHRG